MRSNASRTMRPRWGRLHPSRRANALLRMRRSEGGCGCTLNSISNCQTARRVNVRHHARRGCPPASSVLIFLGRSVTSGFFFHSPKSEGAERHTTHPGCLLDQAGDRPRRIFRGRPRLTALHRGVLRTLGPLFLVPDLMAIATHSGKVLRDATLGAVLRRGADIQGRPGSRLRSRDRRRRSPFALSFALQSAPQRTGMRPI